MVAKRASPHRAAASAAGSDARASMAASLELLWQGRTPSTKGPAPTIKLEEIVDAAIEVADADGVDALSMRRIARELGVGTMSLYRYVPDKSVLVDLMVDRVNVPRPAEPEVTGRGWRDALQAEAWGARALHLRHPWLLQINWARPVIGPNLMAGMELVVTALEPLSLTDQQKVMVLSVLDAFVIGSVRTQIMYESAADDTGLSEAAFWQAQLPFMERAMASDRYPTMAAMAEDTFDAGWEETFAMGLRHLLDGLAADLDRRDPDADGPA